MSDTLDYLASFAQFPLNLRGFIKNTITVKDAKRIVSDRMAHREENFLQMARRSIYSHPTSPYLALLNMAGYSFDALSELVKEKGLEGALHTLREAGVYVTFEEFKGRKPIVRGSKTIAVTPNDFDNPAARQDFVTETGGSSGRGIYVSQNLTHIAENTASHLLMLDAFDVVDVPGAVWAHMLPGAGLHFVLTRLHANQPVLRWFSGIGWRDSSAWFKYSSATLYMLFWLRLYGKVGLMPVIARPNDALLIATWLRDAVQKHGKAVLYTNVSQAVRVSLAALEAGFDLRGVTIRAGAEPITDAKAQAIEKAGVRIMPNYGSIETGTMGVGCAKPSSPSDVHLAVDSYGLITYPVEIGGTGIEVPAFNITTLRRFAPKVMLNYQSDDYGIVEERACGCGMESHGYKIHLRDIGSYSKLLSEGVTLMGNELIKILEEVLPARFGGTPLDYQIQEVDNDKGLSQLYLVIHPRLEIANDSEVVKIVLQGLAQSSPTGDATRLVWQQSDTIQVKRMEPKLTARGKFLPLYIKRIADSNTASTP